MTNAELSSMEIKFTRGVPPPESFPVNQIAQCAQAVLERDPAVILQYGPSVGYPGLRAWLASESGVNEKRVFIGQGSLQILDMIGRITLKNGDLVFIEEPTYDRAATLLRRDGGQIKGIRVEEDGVDTAAMETNLKAGDRPVLFYTIPDFQNPSGTVMSIEKRKHLAELARTYNFWIVEDVPYRKLRYRGTEKPSVFEFAPDRVLQMSSFSKRIVPGLRVGYVIAPEEMAQAIARYAEDTYINSSYFNHAIVLEFIRQGWLTSNLEKLKALYAPRLDATLSSLEACFSGLGTWSKPDGGFFIGVNLNFPVEAATLLKQAKAANILLSDGRGFYPNGGGDGFVRLPFCALTSEEINAGVHRLAEVVKALKK